jgi:hypothetical protein
MQSDTKCHLLFVDADGSNVSVSIEAAMYVIGKYRIKQSQGRWEIQPWMVKEMAAFDKAHGVPPMRPEVVEDVLRMDKGKAPIHSKSDDWQVTNEDDLEAGKSADRPNSKRH